jgi:hypothetical protein
METYATAIGVIYRISQQMINIDNHCRQKNQQTQLPIFPKENNRNYDGYKKVQNQMDDRYSPITKKTPLYATPVCQIPARQ